ncbi:MAG: 50S ribosomal protein L25 [Candidatus Omnitrophota bacterium]|nr:50S ribosomal protein L25 [Candidatus Omnitrophota bacterium]MBU1929787.1 50S ribosomal protein L25 [Candidatus Omnitrophota bacterium]MBU2035211.1 50S ribosomal protein L25 [Candidatus Omnitrophota bacterium]MBU2221273.1 50S ribosomal protein L25 [Candidatus Omnitrophota bacterium]MBU2258719.1 50S ribosomal protein L25 [Candidatus Omnitrophota bacterium]
MEEILLNAEQREELGKSGNKALKKTGSVPAVVYKDGKESMPVKIGHKDLYKLLHEHRLENLVLNLNIKDDKNKKPRPCLIKEIQYDPVKGDIIHVDFNEISLTKVIKVNVPVTAKGEPVGVKQEGGSLEHILWEVTVECLPTEIPKDIEVDVTALKIGDSIHVKDITFPANIKVITEQEAVVLSVVSPMKEEVVVPVEGEEKFEPEVIKEKKEVPGEEGEAEEVKDKEKEKK